MRRSLRACLPKKKTSQVVTINSGALIAGLSQIKNHDFVPPAVIGSALLIWAVALGLVIVNARRFTRDRLASSS